MYLHVFSNIYCKEASCCFAVTLLHCERFTSKLAVLVQIMFDNLRMFLLSKLPNSKSFNYSKIIIFVFPPSKASFCVLTQSLTAPLI